MDAGSRDGGFDMGARDAGPRDGFVERDAGSVVCPAPSGIGFRVIALEPAVLGFDASDVSVGGDGASVYLVAHESFPGGSTMYLYLVDAVAGGARDIASVPTISRGRVSVEDGVARVTGISDTEVFVIEARGDDVREVGRTEVAHATRIVPVRPAWNGANVIFGGPPAFFGPLTIGAPSVPWVMLDGSPMDIAAQADTGVTELVRSGPDGLTFSSFDREGSLRAPVVVLDSAELWVGPALGWLDDGTEQPIVIAGIVRDDDGAFRVFLQRFRLDGSRGGGFSAPFESGFGSVDLTTVPVPPLSSGYGMVAAHTGEPALFHGAGPDFVGDASDLPFECGHASIAAGPCGYVIACPSEDGIQLALAIPPAR